MRVTLLALATLAVAGCTKTETTNTVTNVSTTETSVTAANMTNAAAPAAGPLGETTWEFKGPKGEAVTETVDASGNYVAVTPKGHFDHGTVVMKDGKACFTSKMDKQGEVCWTDPKLAVGATGESVSDRGEKIAIKRVEYKALAM